MPAAPIDPPAGGTSSGVATLGMTAVGTLYYNGYSFDGTSRIKVNIEFVRDPSNRTVLYHRHTFTVTATIASAASTTDTDVATIRALLSKQGRHFVCTQRGFGDDLIVNSPTGYGLRDVDWGPKPEELSWTPLAGNCAGEIVWRVVVCVPVCDTTGTHRTDGLMSFNYDIDFDIDDRGWTTRTINGSLRIAQTRPPGNLRGLVPIIDTADRYRQMIKCPIPVGFKRRQKYTVSEDKSTLTFSLVDTQIPSPNTFAPGVVHIDAKHRASWRRANRGGMKLHNTISAQIELLPTLPKVNAYTMFAGICANRIGVARTGNKTVLIESLDIEEDFYGYASDFSMSYVVFRELDEIIFGTGLFTPVPGSANWAIWQGSVAALYNDRGRAGLTNLPADDVIIDMCTQSPPPQRGTTQDTRPQNSLRPRSKLVNEKPPPEKSYLDYRMSIEINRQLPVIRQSTSQYPYTGGTGGTGSGGGLPTLSGSLAQESTNIYSTAGFTLSPTQKGQYDDTFQISGAGRHMITLTGNAMRGGYEIPQPKLLAVGDQSIANGKMVEVAVRFAQEQEGVYFGLEVYQAAWEITYVLANAPNKVETPPPA